MMGVVVRFLLLVASVGASVVSVNLTVGALFFNTTDTPISFWTRAYNGRLPGPTIRVRQGDQAREAATPPFPCPRVELRESQI